MSLLRRTLQEKHIEDGKIFFMDSDVLISYQGQYLVKKVKITNKIKRNRTRLRYVRLPSSHVHHPKTKHFYKDNNWQSKCGESIKKIKILTSKIMKILMINILLVCNRGTEGYGGSGIPAHDWARETIKRIS